ncbi:MAG: DUF4340 domain-containing protein [Epulopiscium sp.]|nr:DUF4340 domain-containing protein [Candidatus Epulonipiscium sp.]
MKKSHTLILLVVLLGALLGTSFYLKNRPEEETQVEVDEGKIELSRHDREEVVKMILETQDHKLVFERGENGWIANNDPSIPLNESSVRDLEYSFSNMYSEQIVEEDPEDLDKYGLKKPASVATVILKDGTEKTFYLGNKTATQNTYYLMVKGDPKVYTVWMNHGIHFTASLQSFRETTLPNVDNEQVIYFKLKRHEQPTVEVVFNEEDGEGKAYGVGIWSLVQPYKQKHMVHSEEFTKVLTGIPVFTGKELQDDHPKDLSLYGLDNPIMELEMKDMENNQIHILFGSEYDNGKQYFKLADEPAVYGISKSSLSTLQELKPFTLLDKFAYIVNIDFVDQIKIEAPGKKYTIELKKVDEDTTTYFINGKEIEEKPFKDFYQSLIGITADAENKEERVGSPEITTTFTLNVEPHQVIVQYAPYNRDFYAVIRDGSSEFVASKGQLTQMLTKIENLLQNE